MSPLHGLRKVAVTGAATICAAVFALNVGMGAASASTLNNGGPATLTTQGAQSTINVGTPYDSGQKITVSTVANSTLNAASESAAGFSGGLYYMEMCTDQGGTSANLPTSSNNCEAATLKTISKTSNGAFTFANFPVYDLPDVNTLGSPSMTGSCDTNPNFCVIGIFSTNPANTGAFQAPTLFSAPFQMQVGDGTDTGSQPGDGTPEVPLAIGLPLAAVAIFGGWTLRNRRRRQHAHAA